MAETTGTDQTQTPAPEGQTPPPATPQNFDQWVATQTPEIRTAYESHTKGLQSALQGERAARKQIETQLRDAAAAAEKGSKAEAQLAEIANKLAEADRRARFAESSAGKLTDVGLAYIAAQRANLFAEDGTANLDKLKELHPALFAAAAQLPQAPPVAPTNPGAGTRKAALTRADLAGMTPDEINTRWSEVQEALKR